jgi:hypothetical protein
MWDGRISNTSMNQTLNAVLTKAWPHDGECETARKRELGNRFNTGAKECASLIFCRAAAQASATTNLGIVVYTSAFDMRLAASAGYYLALSAAAARY